MNKLLWTAALAVLVAHAGAQEGYSAKALFLGTDGRTLGVSTLPAEAPPGTTDNAKPEGAPGGTPVPLVAGADNGGVKPAPVQPRKPTAPRKPVQALAAGERLGASYFIRLKNADGTTRDVLASRQFKSGERFQLGVRVNRPTYVYIFNEDARGKTTQLYPQPGRANRVDAMGVVFLPSEGAFEFDVEPGIEQLTVVLAQTPQDRDPERMRALQPDLVSDPSNPPVAASGCDAAPSPGSGPVAGSIDGTYAAKGIVTSPDRQACSVAPAYAAKGIVFSDDPTPPSGQQVASYVVKPVASRAEMLTLKLKLLHR